MNLLSTGRLYVDQVRHSISAIYGKPSSELAAVNKSMSEQYDSRLGYRAMEALRNHVQHRELPIAEIGFPGLRIEDDEHVETISIWLDARKLRDDETFKASILRELTVDDQDGCELKPLIRDYVTGVGRVHEAVRTLMAKDVSSGDTVVLEAISRYKTGVPSTTSLVGLYALAYEGGHVFERLPLFEDPMRRRAQLVQQNSTGAGRLRFIVSSD